MTIRHKQPNIIFVVWDTARARNLSCYGHERLTTPTLDKLANQSVLYQHAVSVSPWTLPSHASLFSGLYPSQHNVDRRHKNLRDVQTPVLAESLRDCGYQTVGFSSNTWVSAEFGFDRGFEHFYYSWQIASGKTDFFEVNRKLKAATPAKSVKLLTDAFLSGTPVRNLANGLFSHVAFRYDKGARHANRQIRQWFGREYNPDRPFFMFINYMEPHLKYQPPSNYRKLYLPGNTSAERLDTINQDAFAYLADAVSMEDEDFPILEALYDAELTYLDYRFAELLEIIKDQGDFDNSMLIVTSDHGENIGDHGLMDHQYSLHETLLKVPLIIRFPGNKFASTIVDRLVESRDIMPTVLDYLRVTETHDEMDIHSRSLLPDRQEQHNQDICLAEYLQPQPSIAEMQEKYPGHDCSHYDRILRAIYNPNGYKFIWSSDGKHQLYDLAVDPDEMDNLYGERREYAEQLQKSLNATVPPIEEFLEENIETEWLLTDSAIKKRLEDLGYL